jgi:hypothetical protein
MLPTHTIQKILATIPPELQEIVLELRNLVAEVAPDATEKVHPRGFSYYYAQRGGTVSAGICEIGIYSGYIRLGFMHGSFLPDPKGLLVGDPKYKKHLCITDFAAADWDYCRELIKASASFDPYTLSFR